GESADNKFDVTGTEVCILPGCKACESNTQCLKCNIGYFLSPDGSCVADCGTLFKNEQEGTCTCISNSHCQDPEKSTCNSLSGICEPCRQDIHCKHIAKVSTSMSCAQGTCIECPKYCLKCSTPIVCEACQDFFTVVNGNCKLT